MFLLHRTLSVCVCVCVCVCAVGRYAEMWVTVKDEGFWFSL